MSYESVIKIRCDVCDSQQMVDTGYVYEARKLLQVNNGWGLIQGFDLCAFCLDDHRAGKFILRNTKSAIVFQDGKVL